jgi:hypothetical protein
MKRKIMYSVLAFGAMLSLFGSCSNDEGNTGEAAEGKPKSVTVRISVPSTYAAEATAIGKTPPFTGTAYLFFIGEGIVRAVKTAEASALKSAGGETFTDIPALATGLVIIGNSTSVTLDGSLTSIAPYDPVSKLDAIMFQQANQTNPETAVNVYGYTEDFETVGDQTTATATVTPAISRIEIGEVSAKSSGGGTAIALTSFKLAGIYINNTYTKIGTDYETLPSASGDILNYAKDATVWENGYPARYRDEFSNSPGTSFTPGGSNKWSYYVFPVKAGHGTTIDGEAQTSVPHIVLKIVDATASGYTFPSPSYITIKELTVTSEGGIITALRAGKVYRIDDIEIAGENLSAIPEPGDNGGATSLVVKATLTNWTDAPTTPTIPK